MKPSKILSITTSYEQIVKRAFTEAPPILLNKLYNIYAKMYLDYCDKIKSTYHNKKLLKQNLMQIPNLEENENLSPVIIETQKEGNDAMIMGYKRSSEYKLTKGDLAGWKWEHLFPVHFYSLLKPIEILLTIGPSVINKKFNEFGFLDSVIGNPNNPYNPVNNLLAIGTIPFSIKDFQDEPEATIEEKIKDKIQYNLESIKQELNIQLIHYFQQIIPGITFGLPPRTKEPPKHSIEGISQNGEIDQKEFRLINFYPNLSLLILHFKRRAEDLGLNDINITSEQKSKFIKDFIGTYGITNHTHPIFRRILNGIKEEPTKYNEEIYQIMVKKFLAEIARLGYEP